MRKRRLLACCLSGLWMAGSAYAASVPSDADVGHMGATPVAKASASATMTLAFVLPQQHQAELATFLRELSTRGSPTYHRFLSAEEFNARFGARVDDVTTFRQWAEASGLTLRLSKPGSGVLLVRGSAAQLGAALGVTFGTYRTAEGRLFTAADQAPNLPGPIAKRLIAIAGLNGYTDIAALARPLPHGSRPINAGHGPLGGLSAADLRTAYVIQTQAPAKADETVAVFEQGGFDPNDVAVYRAENKLPRIPVAFVGINGQPNVLNGQLEAEEAALDIDAVSAVYPNTHQILVYGDSQDSFDVAILAGLDAVSNDRLAQTLSISYGTDEIIQGRAQAIAENQLFAQLKAEGIAVFVAAGDNGAYGRTGVGLNVSDPASQPLVTAVGGTTLFTDPTGQEIGEIVWNELFSDNGATGGGVSKFWPIPTYQALIQPGPINRINGTSAKRRNIPDLAAVGDPLTGAAIYCGVCGGWEIVGGTSLSAPLWAGFYALNNSVSKALGLGRIGNFNDFIYGKQYLRHLLLSPGIDSDIGDGSNGNKSLFGIPGYNAGQYFDDCSGLGSPIGSDWLGSAWYNFDNFPGPAPKPPTGLRATATGTSITLSWEAVPGVLAYIATAFVNETNFTTTLVTSESSVTFTGLHPATEYFVELGDEDGIGLNAAHLIKVKTLK